MFDQKSKHGTTFHVILVFFPCNLTVLMLATEEKCSFWNSIEHNYVMFRVAWSETQDQYQFDFEISGWILKQKQKNPTIACKLQCQYWVVALFRSPSRQKWPNCKPPLIFRWTNLMFLYPTLKPQLHVVLNQIVLSALDLSRSQGTKAGEQCVTEGSQIDCK